MATGDLQDFAGRLRKLLPRGWFADPGKTSFLDGVLGGIAHLHATGYAWVRFASLQLRLATVSGEFLDMLASEFLGTHVIRRTGESDASLRARVRREILRPRTTVSALEAVLRETTGYTPTIFEPALASDAAHYGPAADDHVAAYDAVGAYGSRLLPYQVLVTAYRPSDPAQASDADIREAVLSVLPVATVAWLRITDAPTGAFDLLDDSFVLDESLLA